MKKLQDCGRLFVISAPSGAGKSTLCNMVVDHLSPKACYSVSYTTRQAREGEQTGVDYHFVSREEFSAMVDQGEFVEWAEVHGNFYGTSVASIEKSLSDGQDIFLDVDTQGAMQIRERFPNAVYIFITVPSFDMLEQRIKLRGSSNVDNVALRIKNAHEELEHFCEYDYLVINDDKERAFKDMLAIYQAEHLRTYLYEKFADFMKL